MDSTITEHKHTGVDSPKIDIKDLEVITTTLTPSNGNTLSTGGTEALITTDSQVIDNLRTRLNELENHLISLGLLN